MISEAYKRKRWTREQIRAARCARLAPLIESEGMALIEKGGGNYQLPDRPGLIVKDSYWRWPTYDMQGNTIDFFVKVLGRSFSETMQIISSS